MTGRRCWWSLTAGTTAAATPKAKYVPWCASRMWRFLHRHLRPVCRHHRRAQWAAAAARPERGDRRPALPRGRYLGYGRHRDQDQRRTAEPIRGRVQTLDDAKRDGKWRKVKVKLVPPAGLPPAYRSCPNRILCARSIIGHLRSLLTFFLLLQLGRRPALAQRLPRRSARRRQQPALNVDRDPVAFPEDAMPAPPPQDPAAGTRSPKARNGRYTLAAQRR